MRLRVEQVSVEAGSTIGFGLGRPIGDDTVVFVFAGDRRSMVALGEEMVSRNEPMEVEVPETSIVDRWELPDF